MKNLSNRLRLLAVMLLLPCTALSKAPIQSKNLSQLKSNLKKVESSIELTKTRMKNPQEIQFLPDLYFTLAELYSEKARYMYSVKVESNPTTPSAEMDFTAEKRPKLDAIETFKNLIDRYPQYTNLDKAVFALGTEYREMNDSENALKTYKKLIDMFPKSTLWDESQIIIGNIYFDKKDFEFAFEQYAKVLKRPEGPNTAMAYYKSANCLILMDQFLKSMQYFDRVFKFDPEKWSQLENRPSDIREEALILSVWPMSELKPEDFRTFPEFQIPTVYYKKVSPDLATYRRVLMRLAKRFDVKKRTKEMIAVWYEVLKLAEDPSMRREAMEAFYLALKADKQTDFPSDAGKEVAKTLWALRSQQQDYEKYEPLLRDIVTAKHNNAMKLKRPEDLIEAATAYEDYLWVFEKSKYREAIEINQAEAYFNAGQFTEAGRVYLNLSEKVKDPKKQKDYLASSTQSFIESFKDINNLNYLMKIQGRHGFRKAANSFIRKYPNDKDIPVILFNLGKSLYDEQNYDASKKAFNVYLKKFPQEKNAQQACLLILDAYYVRDDLKGLVAEGKRLNSTYNLSAEIKAEVTKIAGQAQLKNVRSLAGDFSSKDYADKFLQFAKSNGNSGLGETALLEAFTSLKANYDFKAFEVGESYLGSFGTSPKAKEVLTQMSQLALITADYRKAAGYLTAYSQRFKTDNSAREYAKQAAMIYDQLGDVTDAVGVYNQIDQPDAAAKLLFRAGQWSELQKQASKVSGTKGQFYQGLALYRSGNIPDGMGLLRRVATQSSSDQEEKAMIAQAGLLSALQDLEAFKKIGEGQAFTPQILQQKVQALQYFDQQTQNVINIGVGRWVIASLAVAGQAHSSFVQFLNAAPTPPGMTPAQLKQILQPQVTNYSQSAKNYFAKCLEAAEQYDIFTRFVESCRTSGATQVSEAEDSKINMSSSSGATAQVSGLRKQLYKEPRNMNTLQNLAKAFVAAGDYPGAIIVLNRMNEIDPQNGQQTAQMGMVSMYMNDLEQATNYFKDALSKNSNQPLANAGMKGLYRQFKFSKKEQLYAGKSRSPASELIVHPWAK